MVAYATQKAIELTLESGRATFWSRSRNELWQKGRAEGNGMDVTGVLVDCDADMVIYLVSPDGPTCHTGKPSCFFRSAHLVDGKIQISDVEVPFPTLLARLESSFAQSKSGTAKEIAAKLTEEAGFYKKFPGREIAVEELTLNPPTENSKGLRIGNFPQIRDVVDEELEAVWSGKKNAKAALDEAVKRGNEQLRKFEAASK